MFTGWARVGQASVAMNRLCIVIGPDRIASHFVYLDTPYESKTNESGISIFSASYAFSPMTAHNWCGHSMQTARSTTIVKV